MDVRTPHRIESLKLHTIPTHGIVTELSAGVWYQCRCEPRLRIATNPL